MDISLSLQYQRDEVVSAQRMRFLYGMRFKTLLIFSVFALAYLIWNQLRVEPANRIWLSPVFAAAIFILVPALVYWLMPGLDFRFNKDWSQEFRLQFTKASVEIYPPEADKPLIFSLGNVFRVLENTQSMILFFENENSFIILPKRIFSDSQLEELKECVRSYHPKKWILSH